MYRCLDCNHVFDELMPEYLEDDDLTIEVCPKCAGEQFVSIPEDDDDAYFSNLLKIVVS